MSSARAAMQYSRKQVAFGMRALAAAGVVDSLWSGLSCYNGSKLTMSAFDVDAATMSPLDTHKFDASSFEDALYMGDGTFPSDCGTGEQLSLFAKLHQRSGKACVAFISNRYASWISAQASKMYSDGLPAYDMNCAMFARQGDVQTFATTNTNVEPPPLGGCRLAIAPNHGIAVLGDSIEETVVRAIYADLAVQTMFDMHCSGDSAMVADTTFIQKANNTWDCVRKYPELRALRKRMALPDWWDRIELNEYNESDLEELQIVADVDIWPSTLIARVGGTLSVQPSKYTIRLANGRHLDVSDSVFSRLNHSFDPNVRVIPLVDEACVVIEALKHISVGDPLCFDYTTTEEPVLAEPFVDIETGKMVGSQQ